LKKNRVSKNWKNKQKKDIFFRQSKIQGYRSRSAFKLIEINKKFKLIKNNLDLLDLGASPGGWSQVASKLISSGRILSVDIKEMEKIEKVTFMKGSIDDRTFCKKIYKHFDKKIDVVISDMAANTTGNKNLDSFRTGQLCINAMNLAKDILKKDGIFLSKIFMGSSFLELQENAKKNFKKVVLYKPLASKKESKELYIFCKGISVL
jgi:23S rRNA (uridine2552-2'-O)-methyltransferase